MAHRRRNPSTSSKTSSNLLAQEDDEVYYEPNNGDGAGHPLRSSNNPSPMISMPAALAAILIVGGLLALVTLFFVSPTISTNKNQAVNSIQNGNRSDSQSARVTKIAAFFSPEVKRWEKQIVTWAATWNLDPNLVATVMQIESCGDAHALSRSGALGLFQVMPFHFEANDDAFNPQVNAQRGLAYLRQAYDARQGDIRATFASYNGGIQGASQSEAAWPEETLRYAYWGSGIFADARSGNSNSPTLDEWMNAGGASLCAQAGQRLASTAE